VFVPDFDPEDAEDYSSSSQFQRTKDTLNSFAYDFSPASDEPKLLSEKKTLRKNLDVNDVVKEYEGKVISRKDLKEFSDEDEAEDSEEGEDDEQSDDLDEDANESEENEEGDEIGNDDEEEEADEDGMEDVEGQSFSEEDEDENAEDYDDESQASDEADDDGDEDAVDRRRGKKLSDSMFSAGVSDQQSKLAAQLKALEESEKQADENVSLFHARGKNAATKTTPVVSTYTKSVHMKNQVTWYSQLLNLRIRMQSLLNAANRLPPDHDTISEPNSTQSVTSVREQFESVDASVPSSFDRAFETTSKLMEELMDLQHGLMKQNEKVFNTSEDNEDSDDAEHAHSKNAVPQFKGVSFYMRPRNSKRKRSMDDDNDSDTSDDLSSLPPEQRRSRKLDAYWTYLSNELDPFLTPIQNALINKWNLRTQMSAGNVSSVANLSAGTDGKSNDASFKVINQSILSQIDSVLLDEERLIRRAQLYRSDGELLGRVGQAHKKLKKAQLKREGAIDNDAGINDEDDFLDSHLLSGRHVEEYDTFIYDDGDYYQSLLQEIIHASHSMEDAGHADDMHNKELLASAAAARRKAKKNVDRNASKGRRLRYTVHPKLANFMAPALTSIGSSLLGDNANTGEGGGFAVDELFMNLFGARVSAKQQTKDKIKA